jgi:hypothetical protein
MAERIELEYARATALLDDLTDVRFKLLALVPTLALVYAAALAGWGYLVAWGALSALGVGHSREVGVVIGAAWGLVVLFEVRRLD